MQHLTPEDLARLVDEAPTTEEALHLESCDECELELAGLRTQTSDLSGLADLAAPPEQWERLELQLEHEGLLTRSGRASFDRRFAPLLAIAASLVLFLSGGVVGATMWENVPTEGTGIQSADLPDPQTVGQAQERLLAAEATYLEALTDYAELNGLDGSADPVNRLAALEGIVLTTRAALEEAPADPVINSYHLAALGQREAIMRQLVDAPDKTWF